MKFKSVKEIKILTKLIENFQDPNAIENLELYVGHLLNGFPTFTFELDAVSNLTEIDEGYGVYRSRAIKDVSEIKYERDLWEPPLKFNKIGRMNFSSESILYCSNHFVTTFFELNAKPGDIYVTAKFEKKMKPELNELTVISFGESLEKYLKNKKINVRKISKIDIDLTRNEKEKYLIIMNFLTRLFRENRNANRELFYLKTATIAKFYRKQCQNHGFFYPSVKANYGSYNLALDSVYAKKYLEIKSIIFYKILDINSHGVTYQFISQVKSISQTGELVF